MKDGSEKRKRQQRKDDLSGNEDAIQDGRAFCFFFGYLEV
jgi:hypothetical protein